MEELEGNVESVEDGSGIGPVHDVGGVVEGSSPGCRDAGLASAIVGQDGIALPTEFGEDGVEADFDGIATALLLVELPIGDGA